MILIHTHRQVLTKMNESAVAESVGVILIVAVTVILAAVIAAYAFGLVQDVNPGRNIILTADQTGPNQIMVTYRGGGSDVNTLTSLRITWPTGAVQSISTPKVGDSYYASNIGIFKNVTPAGDHIVVAGHFTDGKDTILLNTFI